MIPSLQFVGKASFSSLLVTQAVMFFLFSLILDSLCLPRQSLHPSGPQQRATETDFLPSPQGHKIERASFKTSVAHKVWEISTIFFEILFIFGTLSLPALGKKPDAAFSLPPQLPWTYFCFAFFQYSHITPAWRSTGWKSPEELSRSYGWPHTTNAPIWPPRSLETPTKKPWKVSQASRPHRGFIPTTRAPKTLRANETEFELQLGHVRHSPLHLLFKLSRVLQD